MAKILVIATLAFTGIAAELPPPNQGQLHADQQSQSSNTYGTPAEFDRSLSGGNVYGTPSKEYGAPNDNSNQFGDFSASSRSEASNRISNQYGAPGSLSHAAVPSSQLGSSGEFRKFSSDSSHLFNSPASSGSLPSSNSLSRQYNVPASSSKFPGESSQSSNFGDSSQFNGAPSFSSGFGSAPQQYEAPGTRTAGKSTSQFGASASSPQFSGHSSSRFEPSGSLSKEYGAPAQSDRFGSLSSSSSQYGAPAPSSSILKQYGAPSSSNRINKQNSLYGAGGVYSASKGSYNAQDDAFSEPANYQYSYNVQDPESGNQFSQEETRQNDNAYGVYRVLLPDGRVQIVEYQADSEGYKPRIKYDDTGSRGYTRGQLREQNQGPY